MPHTTGDLEYDPQTNTYRPIGGNPIPPYQAGGAAATAAGPAPEPGLREQMRKELRDRGLPLPPYLEQSEAADRELLAAELASAKRDRGLDGGQASSTTSAELGDAPQVVGELVEP